MITELITSGLRNIQRLASTNNPDQWLIDWVNQGQATSSGEHITEENALNCPSVKAAVSCLSEAMMTLGIEICKKDKSGRIEVATDHPLQAILDRAPNPETAAATWWDTEQNHLGTYGNCYSWIQQTVRGDRTVGLWNQSPKPERTKPVRSRDDGKIYYELRDDQGQLLDRLPAAKIFHVKYFSMDGIEGKSPVRMIREAIGGDRAAERLANEIFKNGDMAMGYFTHPGKMSEASYARLKKSLAETSEHGSRHRKSILEEGMTFAGTSYSVEQMQMLNARLFILRAVARAYRINPAILFDLEAGGDVTRLGWQFVTFTLMPWCKRWASEINTKLLAPPFFARFTFDAFEKGDPLARSARQRTLFSVGAMSINEIRHEEGFNRLDDANADEHFVPLNMVPLSKADQMGMKGNPEGGDPDKPLPDAPSGGDGVTPAMPGAQEGGRPAGDGGLSPQAKTEAKPERAATGGQLALLEAEAMVAEVLGRMGRIEANEAQRAAKEPKTFLAKVDNFYAGHVETMRQALDRPVRSMMLLRDGPLAGGVLTDFEIDRLIAQQVNDHRAAILGASGCKASELPARVAEAVKGWVA